MCLFLVPSLWKSASQSVEDGTPPQYSTSQEDVWVSLLWQSKPTFVQNQAQYLIQIALSQISKIYSMQAFDRKDRRDRHQASVHSKEAKWGKGSIGTTWVTVTININIERVNVLMDALLYFSEWRSLDWRPVQAQFWQN